LYDASKIEKLFNVNITKTIYNNYFFHLQSIFENPHKHEVEEMLEKTKYMHTKLHVNIFTKFLYLAIQETL
jgi:hypothetical protein